MKALLLDAEWRPREGYRLNEEIGQVAHVSRVAPGDERGVAREGDGEGVHGRLEDTSWRRPRSVPRFAGGRGLTGSKAVDEVVMDHVGDILVSSCRVGEVAHPYVVTVAVSGEAHDREPLVGQLDGGGSG